MGCGNSTATSTTGDLPEASKSEFHTVPTFSDLRLMEEAYPEDEKRKNYGGVYIGLPTDLSNGRVLQETIITRLAQGTGMG